MSGSDGADLEVTIRRAQASDATLMSSWRGMAEVRRFQPMVPLAPARLGGRLGCEGGASRDTDSGSRITWIVEADGNAAGWVALFNINWVHRNATLGFTIAPWAQRQGVGRRGVAQVLDRAFGPGRIRRVEADCDVDNEASQRLPQRLGVHRDRTLRALLAMPQGRRDFYLYSLLSEEGPPAAAGS